jgi:hypothetical protein
LNWSSQNAVSASFNQGIGAVQTSGSRTQSNITSDRTYVLTVVGSNGQTATCEAPVTVTTQQPGPSCDISASPSTVQSGGSTVLSWTTSNAVSASINQGIGSVSLNGSRTVSNITQSKTFTLTVVGQNGQTVTCQTQVVVTQIPNPPSCTLSANPNSVQSGGSSTLFWTSTNASSASLNNGIGAVATNGSFTVNNITSNKNYTLTVRGNNGETVTCHTSIVVTQIPNPPSCTLSANPTQVQSGGSSNLMWTSTNASSASLNNGIGQVGVNGSYTVTNITSNKNFTLTVTGNNGQVATCHASITVTPVQNAPSCTLMANPTSVQRGGSTILSWSTTNAVSASLSHGIGSVSLNGSSAVQNIQSSATYVLTVVGQNGQTITCDAGVTVTEIPNPPSCALTANPNSVQYGGSSTLTWTSQNAVSAMLDNGIGGVAVNGSYTVNNLTSNRTYTLTVTAQNGQTATCQAPIVVQQQNVTPSCTIYASQNTIQQGQPITLTWSSTNAVSAFINPNVGSVGTAGSMQVYPPGNTTYVLTVTGSNGQTVTCQTSVTVTQIQTQVPYCTIYANPTSIQQGQSSTLTWTSQNAQSAQLSSVGSVGVYGSMSVTPYQSTTYTLTVWSSTGQQATCTAYIQVNTTPYYPPTYYPPQPPVIYPPIQYYPPTFPLTNIPYTGQGGPLGNIVLFGLIVAASLSGAYLILYSRGGARQILQEVGIISA